MRKNEWFLSCSGIWKKRIFTINKNLSLAWQTMLFNPKKVYSLGVYAPTNLRFNQKNAKMALQTLIDYYIPKEFHKQIQFKEEFVTQFNRQTKTKTWNWEYNPAK